MAHGSTWDTVPVSAVRGEVMRVSTVSPNGIRLV